MKLITKDRRARISIGLYLVFLLKILTYATLNISTASRMSVPGRQGLTPSVTTTMPVPSSPSELGECLLIE